ncbi:hypothetical protein SK803_08575 [Lentzea sp. BCCO 10_0856]|uniref:Proteins of 100 residues with WXG n=1 Tax=Lentzea miocenica TaxID=3095431 RepID=A0ABU4SWS8_9PSEU|nr:hypothetical protein [Lentzea sp. BCCO 10_0856]MDX8030264.1 hypothetical protein [Lentzea sp. BCCO 10_0856]
MNITEENKLKGSLFIEAYGSLIDGIGKDAESEAEKALDITFNAIGAASATVMLAIDPLGSLIGAGIGWLIEHVSFLRDALNQLMGNPEEIQANVEATKAKAAELRVLAEDHKSGLATFDGWTGASSERFKTSMDGMSQELDELASAVETKAKIVAIMGMLVTVLRDIVRDLIAQLLGSLIGGALLAVAAMIPTFGASIPAFIGFAVGKAVALGVNIASRVARVVAALGRQMKRIGDLDGIMAKISKGWERFENTADVAEITYEGVKAAKDVDKKIDEAVANNQGGGGGTPPGASGGKPAQDGTATATAATLPNAHVGTVQAEHSGLKPAQTTEALTAMRVGTVQAEPMQARRMMTATEPMQARTAAEPMQALQRTQMEAVQPMQAAHRVEALQPMQAAHRVEALQPMQAAHRVDAVEPMQAMQRTHVEAAQPMQAAHRVDAVEPMQAARMTTHEAPVAFSRVEASDSTMVSGVSQTAGTPVHHAVQPLEPQQMYSSVEATPAEPLQPASSGYEPMARTQMSHAYEALEPREGYNPLQAHTPFSTVEATPVQENNPLQSYDGVAQAGGAAAQPLRPAVAYERPTRPSE